MNSIALIILAAIILELLIQICADLLNLRMLSVTLPRELEGYYDPEGYRKSQDYLKVNTRFGWIISLFNLIILLAFWFAKGFPLLDEYIRSLGYGPVMTGIIYIGSLVGLRTLISLPFSIYSTFVIEERFGFNKTTGKVFAADFFKGLIIGVIIGTPLLAGILLFFGYAGSLAWIYCWAAATLYLIAVQYIVPVWIMPLFNKFEPLAEGELKDAIVHYAKSIQFSLKNIYIMDGSKRSGKSNAFFTGFGRNRRIVLFDTLVKQHTVPELVAVLAHEMGHYKKKHIMKSVAAGILQMGAILFVLSIFLSYQGLYDAFFMKSMSIYTGLIFFGMLFSPMEFIIGIAMQALSRRNEYEADRFAVETTGNPAAMSDALKKLSVNNLSNLRPHPLYVFLNYSHPPVLERIRAITGN